MHVQHPCNMRRRNPILVAGFLLLGTAGCAPFPAAPGSGRDYGPSQPVDVSQVPDAVPEAEPRSRYGNPASYTVNGKTYRVLPECAGYHERGIASWYGMKFHGGRTSDGETYDMYAMTAANKVVPLPCYARVTNLKNGRSVIVKINDRGPFVENRIIDLSYAAAKKLGVVATGTALVDVAAVTPGSTASPAPAPEPAPTATSAGPQLYVQVGAYAEAANAARVRGKLESARISDVHTVSAPEHGQTLYKIRIGPLADVSAVDRLTRQLAALGFPDAQVVIP
ncbi:MAG TPA: septal ring lytic transglycosylase RlpA family protein [Gammaproteobacteria bacterium]|nr:septal ring lytic transglycosylase RlpA family protein [Gammaproteobacteria bacterium]